MNVPNLISLYENNLDIKSADFALGFLINQSCPSKGL